MKLASSSQSSFQALRRTQGFTLIELLVSLGVIVITAATAIACMVQLNRQATISRLYTCAQGIVQTQIEFALTDTPYVPQQGQIPDEFSVAGIPADPNTVVYEDPDSGADSVIGTLTTTTSNTNTVFNSVDLHVSLVTVTLAYTYRGRNYTVSANTMRTSDI